MFNDIIHESISFCLPALQILTYWPLSSWLLSLFFWLQYDCRSLKHHILPQKLLKFVSASSHFNSKRNFLRICKVSLARAVLQAHFWTSYWQHNNINTRPNSNQPAFCFSKLFLLLKHSWLTMLVSGVQQSIFLQIIYNYRLS